MNFMAVENLLRGKDFNCNRSIFLRLVHETFNYFKLIKNQRIFTDLHM